ncbi:hypothetical protein [Paenibacillus agricola]|uniref:Uncharacterized protein n=1 Tax=Paenibacillus agricola TaxID=2716264 RepID=A0ABX0JCH0_9BACL|nr:hypothetical protein [Paenibacillus agricola]NHN33258.1 hypothetical protein [Paenibacillus agricola]
MDVFEEMFEQKASSETNAISVNPNSSLEVRQEEEGHSGENKQNGAEPKDNVFPLDRGRYEPKTLVEENSKDTVTNPSENEHRDDIDAPRDLFGELIDSAPVQQTVKEKIGKPNNKVVSTSAVTAASTANKRGWKDQNIEVGIDFTIHYAMRTFRVEELIDEIPESGLVPLNTIREGLFKEYWDFSESRTKWDYDLDQKKLIPIIVGEKNNL